MRKAIALGLVVTGMTLGTAALRQLTLGREELEAADEAATRFDWMGAVAHARGAAQAELPGSAWPERGRARLEALGRDAEARRDDAAALLAYGALRTAVLATHVPGTPSSRWRAVAEEGLARVASSPRDPEHGPRSANVTKVTFEEVLEALQK